MKVMKKRITSLACLIFCLVFFRNARAQQAADFEKAFQQVADSGFDSLAIAGLTEKYGGLLTPFGNPDQFGAALKDPRAATFPLFGMQRTAVYKDNINMLLDSKQPSKRILAYMMVTASGDFGKRNRLSRDLRAGAPPQADFYLGLGLMYMGYNHTSDLFKWVVRNNAQGGGLLFPLLMSLPKDSLRQAAYRFSESKNWNERVYAVQALGQTGKHAQSEKVLRKAMAGWPVHLKGYAIVPAQTLQIGNLLPVLKPVLDSSSTRKVALDALADSPTPADRAFVSRLARNGKTDPDVLNAMKSSHYEETVIDWLGRLPTIGEKEKYFFTVFRDSVLHRDAILPHLHRTAVAIRNPSVLSHLLHTLKGREDSVSQKLLTGFLADKSDDVRSSATGILKGTCSTFLKAALPDIIGNPELVSTYTFDLAIGCGLDNYHEAAEAVYRSEQYYHMTRENALNYLATYPRAKYLPLFREALQKDPEMDMVLTRTAAKGLAALGDTASLEAIIAVSEKERKKSDANSSEYLEAIARLKSGRGKTYLESFLKSDDDYVRKRVTALLEGW